MKAKQIEKLLTKVMNNLIDSISDDRIKNILKNHSFITGGCVPSMIIDEYVNDYDIYITEKKFAKLIKDYYTNLKFDEKDLQKKKVFLPKLITDNSINLTDKIQIVIKSHTQLKAFKGFKTKDFIAKLEYCNLEPESIGKQEIL